MNKIILLGHSDGGIPIVMDLSSEIYGCLEFDIVKNIDLPNCRTFEELYQANFISDKDYDFETNSDLPIQFGVHNSPATYIIFHYFQQKYGIGVD